MAQLQASCSCSCFLKSISHLLPFAGRSESRLEQLLHEHLRKSSGQKAAETLPLWWEQLSACRSQFSIQHHKMRTTGFAWAEVHIPACHPAPRWSVLSLQFECCHPTSWRKKTNLSCQIHSQYPWSEQILGTLRVTERIGKQKAAATNQTKLLFLPPSFSLWDINILHNLKFLLQK